MGSTKPPAPDWAAKIVRPRCAAALKLSNYTRYESECKAGAATRRAERASFNRRSARLVPECERWRRCTSRLIFRKPLRNEHTARQKPPRAAGLPHGLRHFSAHSKNVLLHKQLTILPQDGDVVDGQPQVVSLLVEVAQHRSQQVGGGVVQGQ